MILVIWFEFISVLTNGTDSVKVSTTGVPCTPYMLSQTLLLVNKNILTARHIPTGMKSPTVYIYIILLLTRVGILLFVRCGPRIVM